MTGQSEYQGGQIHHGGELFEKAASVFSIPELASMVFAFADQATLAACAVVCPLWKEPALDELWKHLDSVLPLTELLPDVGTLSLSEEVDDLVRLMRSVDWTKFRSYAQRVRNLNVEPSYDPYESSFIPRGP
ncbi:hypothetical protein M407DRAFT_18650 [Tulasnella calospora MUT 4182]|uniref:F-box domain-containing protein n=1 Tax=Tulasnella calospora MUT 4182 TaxID=1051891 RepID=A0A0C3QJC0_9AGAM|nr:hypothetical protein M407DRAFT_18650 [Tulasnella calospora MUT 4182]